MSNDKTTLADVQPGRRVRLGDQLVLAKLVGAAGLMLAEIDTCGHEVDPAYRRTLYEAWEEGKAALSAQPSPGGQGDALDLDRVLSLADVHAEESREDGMRLLDRGGLLAFAQDVAAALAARQPVRDQCPDDLAVDAFAAAMKAKMAAARAKGRGGWEDPAQCSADDLSSMLRDHVEKGDPRDVAHFCMMLDQRGEAITARQPVGEPVAWMTHHDEPMLFPTAAEAAAYCEDDEQPVPLFRSPAQAVGEPVAWVSPEQLEAHVDPVRGEGGHYLPTRKTPAGKFTQPLYAAPPAQAVDLGALREMLESWKNSDYPFSYEGQCAQRALDACIADLKGWLDSQAVCNG